MRGPFAGTAPARRARITAVATGANLALGAVMVRIAKPMRDGGHDIVPFEVAGDAETVDRILDDWGPEGQAAARLQTWLDMGYLALYSVATAAGCATVAAAARRSGRPGVAAAGDALGWAAFVAAGLDAVENAAMLAELEGHRGPLPRVARSCALAKFSLILPAVAYAVGGLGAIGVGRLRAPSPSPASVPLGAALPVDLAAPFGRPARSR